MPYKDYEKQKAKNREYKRNRRKYAIENNLCIQCMQPIEADMIGKTTCKECSKKRYEEQKKTREFCKKIGVCPRCQKNSLVGNEKQCIECKAINNEMKQQKRDADRESYNAYNREYGKRTYKQFLENGLCPKCRGKRKLADGLSACLICSAKRREYQRQHRLKQPSVRQYRVDNGLCVWCDNPVEKGYKVCEYHHQLNIKKLDNDNVKQNRIAYKERKYRQNLLIKARNEYENR